MSDYEKREETKNVVELSMQMAMLLKQVSEDTYPNAVLEMTQSGLAKEDLPTLDGFSCSFGAGVIQTLRTVLMGPEKGHPLLATLASVYMTLQGEVDAIEEKYGDYQEHFDDVFEELRQEHGVGEDDEDFE